MSFLATNPNDRVQVFIDGANLYGSQLTLERKVDYRGLMSRLVTDCRLIRAQYFTTYRENFPESFHRMLDFIESNGYTVVTKEISDQMSEDGHVRSRGTMLVEMGVAMLEAAVTDTQHIVLFSGDGELTAAVEACKRHDARVTVISSKGILSGNLRRACDDFISLENLPNEVWE